MVNFYKRVKSYIVRIDESKITKTMFPFKIILYLTFILFNITRWLLALKCINRVNTLADFYDKIYIHWYRGNEGHTQQSKGQTEFLINITKTSNHVFEIGFNGGHSAETILKNNNDCKVISCDIGWHFYTKYGEWYLKKKYGDRFKLHIGDSKDIVPNLDLKEYEFDVIFIDGGHEYNDALQDIINCRKLANRKTVLLLDDVLYNNQNNIYHFNSGPTKAWNELISKNFISKLDYQEFKEENIFRSFITGNYEL
tara:strand:+ start:2443 stop:3204 length:762 start_codon:yes stop_codon:yes gene_type:complete